MSNHSPDIKNTKQHVHSYRKRNISRCQIQFYILHPYIIICQNTTYRHGEIPQRYHFPTVFFFFYNFVEWVWFRVLQLIHLLKEHFSFLHKLSIWPNSWSRLILHDGELYQYMISNKLYTRVLSSQTSAFPSPSLVTSVTCSVHIDKEQQLPQMTYIHHSKLNSFVWIPKT